MKKVQFLLFLFLLNFHKSLKNFKQKKEYEKCGLKSFEKLLPEDYVSFDYDVETEDGYILKIFRLGKKNSEIDKENRPVVMFQHGYRHSGDAFLLLGKESGPLVLLEMGFDVWIGNNRGSRYGRRHKTLSNQNPEFWNFTWQDMAEFDLPAIFSLINTKTKQKINYIGHSQGTTQMFAALSDKKTRKLITPFLNNFYALAPALSIKRNKLGTFSKLSEILYPLSFFNSNLVEKLEKIDIKKCLAFGEDLLELLELVCSQFPKYCLMIFSDTEKNVETINPELVPKHLQRFFKIEPNFVSLYHFDQIMSCEEAEKKDCFSKYDRGVVGNLEAYDSFYTPKYNPELVKERIRMFAGEGDLIISPEDAQADLEMFPNADIDLEKIPDWGHLAFIYAKDISDFYKKIGEDILQNKQE